VYESDEDDFQLAYADFLRSAGKDRPPLSPEDFPTDFEIEEMASAYAGGDPFKGINLNQGS
jgi:hypothetical protein